MKIVVLSPHRDDAAFSLSLTVEAWIKRGLSVEVVNCFTRSEYAPYSDAGSVHENDRRSYVTALRSREDKLWSQRFGSKLTLMDLELKDAPLRRHCSIDEVCNLPVDTAEKAFARIRACLERARGSALVLPLALGRHVDHLTARDAALAAITPATLYAFYEDLPYAARPGGVEEIGTVINELSLDLKDGFVEVSRDVQDACVRKRRAALCYDSQIDDDVTDAISRFCVRYEGRERLWMNKAWRNSPLLHMSLAQLPEAS